MSLVQDMSDAGMCIKECNVVGVFFNITAKLTAFTQSSKQCQLCNNANNMMYACAQGHFVSL